MDLKIKLIALLSVVLFVGCGYKVNIMGVDVTDLKGKDPVKVFVGAVASVVAHEGAHYLVAKARGTDIEMTGLTTWETPNERDEYVQHAGFVAQTGIGLILNHLPITQGSDYVLGWNAATTAVIATYPLRHGWEADFNEDSKGNWEALTILSTFNMTESMIYSIEKGK